LTLQFVPFQDTIPMESPTALHKVVVGQLTPQRRTPVPELSTLQLVPFQDTIAPFSPTALQNVADVQLTPRSNGDAPPTSSALQLVPFHERSA
jgi:hypothetical protein